MSDKNISAKAQTPEGAHPSLAESAEPIPEEKAYFAYDGEGNPLLSIYLKSILLTILSFGIYKFWADVAARKFHYQHTTFTHGRFDYHATGLERFKGFLKGIFFLSPLIGVSVSLYFILKQHMDVEDALIFAIYSFSFLFLFIKPLVIVGGRRFALARTSWNNLRFRFDGKVGELYKIYLVGILLIIITLGVYGAWHFVRVYKFKARHTKIGQHHFDYDGDGGDVLGIWVLGHLLIYVTVGIYLPWYIVKIYNYHLKRTTFQGARFYSTLRGGALFKEGIIAIFITIFTLGIGFPWAVTRIKKLYISNLNFVGDIDIAGIEASFDHDANAFMDGIGEAGVAVEAIGEILGG